MSKSKQIVLPTYKLDSNLVLLPGIIYNITFSRFKAAALLYRFKDLISNVSLINNLLNEYDFKENEDSPSMISRDSIQGITDIIKYETKQDKPEDFEWLTLAIIPNTDKIKYPHGVTESKVYTVCRIVGIVDDTTNIKLTLQAITRGVKVNDARVNESVVEINWKNDVYDLTRNVKQLKTNAQILFKSIEKFLSEYRQALGSTSSNLSLTDKKSSKNSPIETKNDLLTLNPLANALYLQLSGSKDFQKAFISLTKLFSQDIDNKTYLRLIDLTCAILPFPNYERLALLNKYKISERSSEINIMITRLNKVFVELRSNNSFVNHWFYNEATNIQKANVVSNELKSIRIILEGMTRTSKENGRKPPPIPRKEDDDDEDDELKAITNFIKNKLPHIKSIAPDSKRLLVKDFKRIKSGNSPGGGNSDFHVIRNYLEIVMDIPWDKNVSKFKSNQEIDVELAKKQLDDDHYGLDHVKKRLIQYLVVLKLLAMNSKNTSSPPAPPITSKHSNTNESLALGNIVIANNDETYHVKQKAKDTVKKSLADMSDSQVVSHKSPIIMLAGPPGTGKTSLAKSIATALGRNFQRLSLGGIKDESEIRGHRRTYVGAMPGLIIQALRKSQSMNPVILLDEIDKVVGGNSGLNKFNGDPSAALLEVLDPEQNNTFIDHYLGFPVDLSQVIFICTANEPRNMTRPLLDRLEMIEIGAYDYNEKFEIGKKYLLPRQINRNGFPSQDLVHVQDSTLKKIIIEYTREAGVRNFERKLGTICRFKAVEYCHCLSSNDTYNPIVDDQDLPVYLGVPYPSLDYTSSQGTTIGNSRIGVVNGLSYNSEGNGSVLVFESIGFDRRLGKSTSTGATLNMTGRLGDVLMESGKIGLIFIKSMIYKNLLKGYDQATILEKFNNLDIHIHVPMGSISKDGPSAGITMTLSFLSVLLEKPVPSNFAMTGEITLRGLVLPIGGIKEKLMGAHLNPTISKMIVPRGNRKDLIEEYSKSIEDQHLINELLKDDEKREFTMGQVEEFFEGKYGIKVFYAYEFYDVIKIVWENEDLLTIDNSRFVECHI